MNEDATPTPKKLRSGYTTGACAAASAKAALMLLSGGDAPDFVDIPFPDGSRHRFELCRCRMETGEDGAAFALASVVKDAGDDPDVTNGAEVGVELFWAVPLPSALRAATSPGGGGSLRPPPRGGWPPQADWGSAEGAECGKVRRAPPPRHSLRQRFALPPPSGREALADAGRVTFAQGRGVGRVTRPGLPLAVGEAAVNPVPRKMILAALNEVIPAERRPPLVVRAFVEHGEILAEKTINHRLGIVGGLSILGTTGIVRPISAEAWTDTIEAAMSVARASGLDEIMLSTGRTSEAAVQKLLHLPEEGLIMMGDYLRYALEAAGRRGFRKIHLAEMWAKMVKAARGVPQTHVRNGALDVRDAANLLAELGLPEAERARLAGFNTAWHIYEELRRLGRDDLTRAVAERARARAEAWSGVAVAVYLVTTDEGVVLHVQD